MSWQVKEQYVDKALGQHIIKLHEPESGAEHVIQIIVGHTACPACGHVRVAEGVNELDPKTILKIEVGNLEQSHAQSAAYALKHGRIPIIRADGKPR